METVTTASETFIKRSRSPDSASNDNKRQRWYYILESDHADLTDSDACETIYSYQDKSTDIVQDTPDTTTSSDSGDMRTVVEYEVASLSEEGGDSLRATVLGLDDDSLTGPEDTAVFRGFVLEPLGSDKAMAAAENACSSAEAEVESRCAETPLSNQENGPLCWHCHRPKTVSAFLYCTDCFRAKKDLYPPRPRGGRKRKRNGTTSGSAGSTGGGSQLSCITVSTETTDVTESSQNTESPMEKEAVFGRCKVCLTLPLDAGFVHSRIAHVYACYSCSQRIWKTRARCPICNYPVSKVIRLIL